jgi:hypothetical protein
MLTCKCCILSLPATFFGGLSVSETKSGELTGRELATEDVPVLSVTSFVREVFVSESQNGELAGSELGTEDVPVSSVPSFFREMPVSELQNVEVTWSELVTEHVPVSSSASFFRETLVASGPFAPSTRSDSPEKKLSTEKTHLKVGTSNISSLPLS